MTLTTPTPCALLAATGFTLACAGVHAQQDTARVISSIPIVQNVAVPRQVCTTQQVMVEQPRSGAGALLGAIAGGAAGNAIGDGSGRAAATALGIFGGAILGNRIEGPSGLQPQNQTTCTTQTVNETRTTGFNVTYEYAGRQYQVQMPQDPGPTIRVQVTPMVPAQTLQAPVSSVQGESMVAAAPAVIYSTSAVPVQRVAVVQPVPVSVYYNPWPVYGTYVQTGVYGARFGHHHHHRHWR